MDVSPGGETLEEVRGRDPEKGRHGVELVFADDLDVVAAAAGRRLVGFRIVRISGSGHEFDIAQQEDGGKYPDHVHEGDPQDR